MAIIINICAYTHKKKKKKRDIQNNVDNNFSVDVWITTLFVCCAFWERTWLELGEEKKFVSSNNEMKIIEIMIRLNWIVIGIFVSLDINLTTERESSSNSIDKKFERELDW